MAKWQYRTVRLSEEEGRDIDLDVEPLFNDLQDDGWEYVSGPEILQYVGSQEYVFLIRRKEPTKSAYEDRGLEVI